MNKTNRHRTNVNHFNPIGNNISSLSILRQSQLIDLQDDQLPFGQNNSFFNPLHKRENSFGFLNEAANPSLNSSTINSFNNMNSGFIYANQCDNIYSETSSERSDTPNSCVTNSSSVSSSFPSFMNLNAIVPFSFDKAPLSSNSQETQIFTNTINDTGSPSNSSTSSETSTTTISTSAEPIKSFNEDFDLNEIFKNNNKSKSSKKQIQSSVDKSKLESDSNGQNNKKNNEMAKHGNDKVSKSEDTYCGYVESFPYYYKLNRLYNALAVQKMQADRMKKNGHASPMTVKNQPGSTQNAFNSHINQQMNGFGNNTVSQQQNRGGSKHNSIAISPSQFQMEKNSCFLGNSPSKGNFPQQNSILIPTNSPTNHALGSISVNQQLIK